MPRANRLCSKPGCLNKVSSNGRCSSHLFERLSTPWERKSSSPYGKTVSLTMKVRVLKEEPVCRICKKNESTEVDHILPRHLGGTDTRGNLQGLCVRCHGVKTSAEGHAALAAKRAKKIQQQRRS